MAHKKNYKKQCKKYSDCGSGCNQVSQHNLRSKVISKRLMKKKNSRAPESKQICRKGTRASLIQANAAIYRQFLEKFLENPIFDRPNLMRALGSIYKSQAGRLSGYAFIMDNRERIENDLQKLQHPPGTGEGSAVPVRGEQDGSIPPVPRATPIADLLPFGSTSKPASDVLIIDLTSDESVKFEPVSQENSQLMSTQETLLACVPVHIEADGPVAAQQVPANHQFLQHHRGSDSNDRSNVLVNNTLDSSISTVRQMGLRLSEDYSLRNQQSSSNSLSNYFFIPSTTDHPRPEYFHSGQQNIQSSHQSGLHQEMNFSANTEYQFHNPLGLGNVDQLILVSEAQVPIIPIIPDVSEIYHDERLPADRFFAQLQLRIYRQPASHHARQIPMPNPE